MDRARVRMLSQIIACDIQPMQNTSTTKYLKEDAEARRRRGQRLAARMDHARARRLQRALERDQLHGKFCHGDTPTMADCCLVPQMFAAERFGVDPTRYPRLALIWENCNRMPAFAAAHPSKQTDAH